MANLKPFVNSDRGDFNKEELPAHLRCGNADQTDNNANSNDQRIAGIIYACSTVNQTLKGDITLLGRKSLELLVPALICFGINNVSVEPLTAIVDSPTRQLTMSIFTEAKK